MANLALFDKGGASAQDSFIKMLGRGKGMFECFDTVSHIRM